MERMLKSAPGFLCVAECRSAEEALRVLPLCKPEVILMDINMPEMNGVECVSHLKTLVPDAQIMMLTVLEDHDLIFNSLAAGANGYMLKKTSPGRLLEAVTELHQGGAPMSGQIARKVVASFHHSTRVSDESSLLSPMEKQVLQRLGRGLLYKEVAVELGLSVSTVRTHVYHIYDKLHVHNRTEAILKGLPATRNPAAKA